MLVTEKEIYNGIIRAKNVENNALCFIREIDDIHENLNENVNLLKRYIDLNEKNEIDREANDLLEELKSNKISKSLCQENIFKFNVKWNKQFGITRQTHSEYIEKFGETFYEQVKRLIDLNVNQVNYFNELNKSDQTLYQEVFGHVRFCKESVAKFHGRIDILEKLYEYIQGSSTTPFIIHGTSGSGKTSVIAKLALDVRSLIFSFIIFRVLVSQNLYYLFLNL